MLKKIISIISACLIMPPVFAQKVVDTHSHFIPKTYLQFLEKNDALLDEDFPIPAWDLDSHLSLMDETGIGISVLTLPAPQPWFGDSGQSAELVRKTNEEMAAIKAAHPGRFLFCATLPLPDVAAAVEEAVYALDVLKADGVKIASNSRGLYLGETTRAILNMVGHNVMARYPGLKVVVPHCGSFLPLSVPRMASLMPVMNINGYLDGVDIYANLSALYYDLAGAPTPETIRELLTITDEDHLLYGTDYPYVAPVVLQRNLQTLKQTLHDIVPGSEGKILYQNASELFKR